MPLINPKDIHTLRDNAAVWFKQMRDGKGFIDFWEAKEKYKRLQTDATTASYTAKKEQRHRVRDQVAKNRTVDKRRHTTKGKAVTTAGPKVNKKIMPSKVKNFIEKGQMAWKGASWKTRGIQIGLSILAWNMAMGAAGRLAGALNGPAIPREYDRGYDLIQERLTDFGSPVKLSKAAGKTLRPYVSSVRRGTMTTVDATIRKNIALSQYRNAIGHGRY